MVFICRAEIIPTLSAFMYTTIHICISFHEDFHNFVRFFVNLRLTDNVQHNDNEETFSVPNMIALAMLNCSLVRLYSDDLVGYGNLEALSLRQNYIEEIPQGFYEYVPNLVNTNMLENGIARVAPNILAPLHRLTSANFVGNRCVDFAANISTLSVLQNILNTNCTFG